MSRFQSYLLSAANIIEQYHGQEPFASMLRSYFSANPKFGSRDRKAIGHLCYCYFRLGKAAMSLSTEDRILLGLFCCTTTSGGLLEHLKPEWDTRATLLPVQKMELAGVSTAEQVFPWTNRVSSGLKLEPFIDSFFVQPDLFIRVRPGYLSKVIDGLEAAGITFQQKGNCIALPNGTRTEELFAINREIVIQDASSQQTGSVVAATVPLTGKKIWDCCAASGGKSLMLYDQEPSVQLTVSDIRESILVNLKKRFREAGIQRYHSFSWNLARGPLTTSEKFDLLLADVPCSGSGTWARTPEQLFYFDPTAIDTYSALQYSIVTNALPALAAGGMLVYITCSVFEDENEKQVQRIASDHGLNLVQQQLIQGAMDRADSMFIAILQKPL